MRNGLESRGGNGDGRGKSFLPMTGEMSPLRSRASAEQNLPRVLFDGEEGGEGLIYTKFPHRPFEG